MDDIGLEGDRAALETLLGNLPGNVPSPPLAV
jgi:hypothetical protein